MTETERLWKGPEMMKVDLHLHTEFSDGTDSPKELLEKIRACGIDFFSITDHDAIAGCEALAGNRSGHAGNEENGTHSGYSAEAKVFRRSASASMMSNTVIPPDVASMSSR